MKTVYLIAGHEVINGRGTGAHGFIDEAVENERLRNDITKILRERNIRVVNDNNRSPLREVISWLRNIIRSQDLIIDIHFNASSNPQATGTETFIPRNATNVERGLARELADVMASTLKIRNRGVKCESTTRFGRLGILSDPHTAVNVLIEVCFVSNENDVKSYRENYHSLVCVLANVIEKYAR
jgi:N-acetylmuramoyl-L-alanine amidase